MSGVTPGDGVTVVKLGGSLLEDPIRRAAALDAIARAAGSGAAGRRAQGSALVVVHGGGRHVDGWLGRLGLPRRVHQGLRITDAPTLDVVVAVLSGLVNKSLVTELAGRGLRAFGMSGVDAGLLTARRVEPDSGVDFGQVGRVARCDPAPIRTLLDAGHLPVIASVACGEAGSILNVNADAAASAIASALGARRLLFLTDVEGLLDARGRRVARATAARVRALMESPAVSGGMRPKLSACLQALDAGVGQVVIAGPAQQERALRSGEGGTRLVAA